MKLEPSVQEEPLSSTGGTGIGSNNSSANGSLGPMSNYDPERDKTDLMPNTLWTGKLTHKSGSVTTPDGKYILHFLFVPKGYKFNCLMRRISKLNAIKN